MNYPIQEKEFDFSPQVLELLGEAGWSPNRVWDDEKMWETIRTTREETGCTFIPEALRVLRRYGGLVIYEGASAWHVDPTRYHLPYGKLDWFEWGWELDKVLFPIGSLGNYDLNFAVDSDGGVYSYGLADFYCGANFEIALEETFNSKYNHVPNRAFHELDDVIEARSEEKTAKIAEIFKRLEG